MREAANIPAEGAVTLASYPGGSGRIVVAG